MKLRLVSTAFALSLLATSCKKSETTTSSTSDEKPAVTATDGSYILANVTTPIPVGKTVTTERTTALEDAKLSMNMAGQALDGTMKQTKNETSVVEAVSETQTKHTITRDDESGSVVIAGQEQPSPSKTNPLLNLPLLAEKSGDTWSVKLAEGTATPEQETKLNGVATQYNQQMDAAIYGTEKRKPGDKWSVESDKLPSFAGLTKPTGTFEVEFKEVKDIDGTPHGVLTYQFDLAGSPELTEEGAPAMKLKLKGTAEVLRSLTDLIDVDVKLTCDTLINMEPAPGATMEITGKTVMTQKSTIK
jgi:hypothetical protein